MLVHFLSLCLATMTEPSTFLFHQLQWQYRFMSNRIHNESQPIAQKLCDNKYKNCITLCINLYHWQTTQNEWNERQKHHETLCEEKMQSASSHHSHWKTTSNKFKSISRKKKRMELSFCSTQCLKRLFYWQKSNQVKRHVSHTEEALLTRERKTHKPNSSKI